MCRRLLLILLTALLASCQSSAPDDHNADTRMDWWREARFGLFLHWGLYSVPAGEWDGNTNHGEWILTTAQIPVDTYEEFVPQFNPVEFDAEAWVLAAKAAGMKYIVITTKHHDGFALYDSEVSDYDIMETPFKRDIMKELAEACERHGLKMCWYHSIMDWNHPDYLPRRGWEDRSAEGADYDRYVEYMFAQVTELLTNYGPIGVMWFDGEWEGTWNHEYGQRLYDLCRELQPDVIVNNRVDKGRGGMAGMDTGPGFAGDFGTPEQEIPATGMPGVDWESCMTMNAHWGYNKNNDAAYKPTSDLIHKLVDIASKGGNFLLNVGPTAEGNFPQLSLDRLTEMGQWMDTNAEAIHGTSASPFANLPWGRCTMKQEGDVTQLYLHVFDWPQDGRLVVPGIGNHVVKAQLLAAPEARFAALEIEGNVILRMLPEAAPDVHVSVIKLTVQGAPVIFEAPQIKAASDQLVSEMEVQLRVASKDLEIYYTLDGTAPTLDSLAYDGALLLTETTTVKARCFFEGEPVSPTVQRSFRKVKPRQAVQIFSSTPGLSLQVYQGNWDDLPDFNQLTAESQSTAATIGLPQGPSPEHQARVFDGFLSVPADGLYTFEISSDDGSELFLHGESVIDHGGLHGTTAKHGTIALAQGLHPIRVEWFNKTGGATLSLRLAKDGAPLMDIPSDWLVH
jgi:alpha-L-fucosidase